MHAMRSFGLLASVAGIGLGCGDTVSGIPAGVEVFTASLNGANERPAVTTTATGQAVITVLGNLVSWKVDVADIDSVTIGHIHYGVADSVGGVMVNLSPTPTGRSFTGTVALGSDTVVDSVLTHMRNGRAYVNIHTSANPGGEVRGQLVKR